MAASHLIQAINPQSKGLPGLLVTPQSQHLMEPASKGLLLCSSTVQASRTPVPETKGEQREMVQLLALNYIHITLYPSSPRFSPSA